MIRVLQCVNDMHRAGLETMLMNYYRSIDKTEIQFDFLTHRPHRSDYDDEIEALGGKVYYAPRLYPQNYFNYMRWMKNFFLEHPEYKIVHSHIDSMSFWPLWAAKCADIPVRIAHSHSTSIDKDYKYILKQAFRIGLRFVANYRFACGKEAGDFLFMGKSYDIIPNAVTIERFLFNQNVRDLVREQLNIKEKLVVGHVGRFSEAKNHEFIIRAFAELYRVKQNAVLMLVGIGEKLEEIKRLVKSLGLDGQVLFLGNRNDVNQLYQAMDVFILPSLYEGVPLVGIEAQFADLPCLFSDRVPREVQISEKTAFIGIDDHDIHVWVKEILGCEKQARCTNRETLINNNYNINEAQKKLTSMYSLLLEGSDKKNESF